MMVRSVVGASLLAVLNLTQPESAAIRGTVADQSGGRLADVEITVTCDDLVRTGLSDAAGRFEVDGLVAADCLVVARRSSFATLVTPVDLRVAGDVRLVLEVAIETEVVVTPSGGARETEFAVPEAVGLVTSEDLETRPRQILPEMLRDETAVLLQQTTAAQGSPFIRGLSAQRILYLIDGVRFNTSSFRPGATQFLAWVSPLVVDSVEVLRGPASVQYGSDALGGTIQLLTARPALWSGGPRTTGRVEGVVGSSDNGGGVDAVLSLHERRFGLRVGGGIRDAGARRAGGDRDSHSVVTRYLGLPSDELYTRLPETGFTQSGGHIAFTARAGATGLLSGLFVHEEQTGVRRYHRMLGGDGLHRSEFEPQQVEFGVLRYERGPVGVLDRVTATLSLNSQRDGRLEQRRPLSMEETQTERTTAVGYVVQGATTLADGPELRFGGEVYDERIGAGHLFTDPISGESSALRPRIPDGTRYTSAGAFAQASGTYFGDRLFLRAGMRYGHFLFRTRPQPALDVDAEQVAVGAATYHVAGVVSLTPELNVTASLGRGFRAPNAFDLGATGLGGGGFEIAAGTAEGLGADVGTNDGVAAVGTGLPVGRLGPESSHAVEIGLKLQTERLTASIRLFDQELQDLIQRRAAIFGSPVVGVVVGGHEIVRQDAAGRAFVAADPRPIVTRVNVQHARIWGVETDMSWSRGELGRPGALLDGQWPREPNRRAPPPDAAPVRRRPAALAAGSITAVARGRDHLCDGTTPAEPRRSGRRPGSARSARWTTSRCSSEAGRSTSVSWRTACCSPAARASSRCRPRVLGDAASAPLFAYTPGFVVVDANAGIRLTRRLNVTLFADNLADQNYRWHGSGVDAAGVSLQLRTTYAF